MQEKARSNSYDTIEYLNLSLKVNYQIRYHIKYIIGFM